MTFNIEKQIDYWKSGADNDLETAEILIQNKKFVQGLFFCHLCIEKITKALVVKATNYSNIDEISIGRQVSRILSNTSFA